MRLIDQVTGFTVEYHDKLFWRDDKSADNLFDLYKDDELKIPEQRALRRLMLWGLIVEEDNSYDAAEKAGKQEITLDFDTALDLEISLFLQPLINAGVIDAATGRPKSTQVSPDSGGISRPLDN